MERDALYLVTPEQPPIFNMALDEWLFGQVCCKRLPPVLRLYSWAPPGVTLGYNQRYERAIDPLKMTAPIPVIRRITGGRAIYHETSEITFSFSTSLQTFGADFHSLSATNSKMSELLKELLIRLGIDAHWQRQSQSPPTNSPLKSQACFQSVAKYELTAGGSKIAGVAQRIKGNFIIFQGSLKLNGISPFPAIGQGAMEPAAKANSSAGYSMDELKDFFPAVFAKYLHLKFNEFSLSSRDKAELAVKIAFLTKNPLEKRGFD